MSDARAGRPWDPAKIVCPGCGRLVDGLEPVVFAGADGRSTRGRCCAACVASLPREHAPDTTPVPPHDRSPGRGSPPRGGAPWW